MPDAAPLTSPPDALLLLADGSVFYGHGIGAPGTITGEICFNTGMTGYQETLTDPSYHGQVITFTFPHIGNVGTNAEDIESEHHGANGLVLRESATLPSSYRAEYALENWLKTKGITGITGVDTRALTRKIRVQGAQNCLVAYADKPPLPDVENLMIELIKTPELAGLELAKQVTSGGSYTWDQTNWQHPEGYGRCKKSKRHVVAVDFGEKLNILRCLAERDCKVTVVPATSSSADILQLKPDGVFLSNGPGDPAATADYAVPVIRELLQQELPIFGICLGHQLLSLALGAKTEKMHQGHRGANHPVKNLETGQVEITSQNHGFVVTQDALPTDVEITHISLFDGTVEGLKHTKKPVFSVQHHPESSPGPHDSQYLFDQFVGMMEAQGSGVRVQSSGA